MEEKLLQYIWQYQLFNRNNLETVNRDPVIILNQGSLNHLAGPDFINARIKIGHTEWAGNIEIHNKSSDWKLHGHDNNEAYRNVILHVVFEHDLVSFHRPTLELNTRISNLLLDKYRSMMLMHHPIACNQLLQNVSEFEMNLWKQRIMAERLEAKSNRILEQLKETKLDWHQVFYEEMAYNFGLKTNANIFKEVAKRLPIRLLAKYKNDLQKIEALLFGMAGFLTPNFTEKYPIQLQSEFYFLKNKHQLLPIKKVNWNFGRIRPASFPTIRIAQFASLIYKSKALFSNLMNTKSVKQIESFFNATPSKYWENHYLFEKKSEQKIKRLGRSKIQNIIINTIVPFQFIFGKHENKDKLSENALKLLEQLPRESNKITKEWEKLKVKNKDAFDSQALTHLFKKYCQPKKCLDCRIGHILLKQENQ